METFNLSLPSAPPGLPPRVRERLRRLGPGRDVNRLDLEQVCGSPSAANHFIDGASKRGLLVPVAWGTYRVADTETLHLLGRLANPVHQRLLSWVLLLPGSKGEPVLFLAPRLWRDTELNVAHPMPVLPLARGPRVVRGAPPQWDAFHADLLGRETWRLEMGGERVGTFRAPSLVDTIAVLQASLDPRWVVAAKKLERHLGAADRKKLGSLLSRIQPMAAPRGHHQAASLGSGPPHRYRLLVPPWFLAMIQERLLNMPRLLNRLEAVPEGGDGG